MIREFSDHVQRTIHASSVRGSHENMGRNIPSPPSFPKAHTGWLEKESTDEEEEEEEEAGARILRKQRLGRSCGVGGRSFGTIISRDED